LGKKETYLTLPKVVENETSESVEDDGAKDLVINAGQWLRSPNNTC